MFGSAFLAGAFVSWEIHDLKKNRATGSAFLAGAFASWENMTWKKKGDWITFPSRGFYLLGKHDLKKARVNGSAFLAGVSVSRRGFCFLGNT